ncbi:hypothetical protein AFCDBAGC_1047 [Methylobacterium cerastii]|uniref:Uncharacterized protein n=1 Tax=Methylobacterium cerastii TaxID=932741 RepID=A0ABQ4QDB0_9HYPH|nr:hypothetical protein [Methylobacterium cerastii]GJD43200.1 hypothetical protein AFCDBAGC_1047 [Methylobacterium cerastii]
MTERTENWWVRVRHEDGSPGGMQLAEVDFEGDDPRQARFMATCASLGSDEMAGLTLVEQVHPPGRALTMEAIHQAVAASSLHGTGYVGRLQACEDESLDENLEPISRAMFTLIDGYFDLQRVAEILQGKENQA